MSDASRHLELRTAAIVAELVAMLDDALGRGILDRDDVTHQFPFIEDSDAHLEELASGRRPERARFVAMADELASGSAGALPLARLAASGIGGLDAADVVVAAALVERDVRFGAVVAALQAPSNSRRLCFGMLATLLGRSIEHVAAVVADLARAGVVMIEHPEEPRSEQAVRIPADVLSVLEGGSPRGGGLEFVAAEDAADADALILSEDVRRRVDHVAAMFAAGELDTLVVRGPAGSGRRSVLRAIARTRGLGTMVVDHRDSSGGPAAASPTAVGALAMLVGALPVHLVAPRLGETVTIEPLPGVSLTAVVAGRHGGVATGAGRQLALDLAMPDSAARRRFWGATGITIEASDLETASTRYALTGGTIAGIARDAAAVARLHGRDIVQIDDIRRAAQERGRQRLETLSTLLAPLPDAFGPVLSGPAEQGYEMLVQRARHRESISGAIGGALGSQLNRGVRAMLTGPSGTGKTLAARALGVRLGLDVYRADIAALVDKYIGETERRLDELLTVAEELDVVLLIDEGDSLMTRRTEVKTSNDRYANLETNYLLQRLETFEGIVLITTNAPQSVDSAFLRRLDVTIALGMPQAHERVRIWLQHLPAGHAVTLATIEEMATRCRFSGAQIRNIVVRASLQALDAGRLVDGQLLQDAVDREFTLSGRSSPLAAETVTRSPYEDAVCRR